MAEFPRYQSKGSLTTQAPAALQTETDKTGEILGKVGQIGQTVSEGAMKWQHAVNTIQKTTAQANFKSGVLDIVQRAQVDPDYNNSKQYFDEVEKLKGESMKGFTSKNAEMETGLQLGYEAKVASIQLDNIYKKKMIDVGQTSSMKLIDAEVNNPTESSLGNIRQELSKQIGAGIFDHKAAYELERQANRDLGENRVNKDLYQATTPEAVDEVTQRLASGSYEKGGVTIDPDKKKSLFEIADRTKNNVEKRIQAQAVEAQTQNRMNTIVGIASGQTPIESLDIPQIAEFDPQLATTLTKVKDFMKNYNPKTATSSSMSSAGLVPGTETTRMKMYAQSVKDVFTQDNNEKLGDFVLRELEKKGDGLTPSIKIAAFSNLAALKARANNPQTPEDQGAADRLRTIQNAVNFLQYSNPYLFPKVLGDFLVKNFISGGASPDKVMAEAKDSLKNELLSRHKSLSKLPALPNKIVDGSAPVEDVQGGQNELKEGDTNSGDYADQPGE